MGLVKGGRGKSADASVKPPPSPKSSRFKLFGGSKEKGKGEQHAGAARERLNPTTSAAAPPGDDRAKKDTGESAGDCSDATQDGSGRRGSIETPPQLPPPRERARKAQESDEPLYQSLRGLEEEEGEPTLLLSIT
jgi:hypothetical protein